MSLQPVPATAAPPVEAAPPANATGDWLACRLGLVEYGIDMRRVHEIRAYERPTRIAGSAACVRGVINLRGAIVPIVDLRLRLGWEAVRDEASTVVVVLNVGGRVVGLVVDAVSEVVGLHPGQLRPALPSCAGLPGDHLRAIAAVAAVGSRTLRLIDVEKLLAGADIGLLEPTLQ